MKRIPAFAVLVCDELFYEGARSMILTKSKRNEATSATKLKRSLSICTVLIVTSFLILPEVLAQHLPIEYMMRIPKYYRLKGGSSQFAYDRTRGALLFDGGPYDTYVTYDRGATWATIFDMKMFYVDARTTWRIDHAGNWYYQGNVYGKLTVNLVSEDAGKSLRYLVVDTANIPVADIGQSPLLFTPPRGVTLDVQGPDPLLNGLYSSCDVGHTWTRYPGPSNGAATGHRAPVGKETINIAFYDESDKGHWLEYNVCDGAMDTIEVTIRHEYRRLSDGTVLEWEPSSLNQLIVTRPGVDTAFYPTYPDSETNIDRRLSVLGISVWNDTMALIIAKNGVLATYGVKTGLRFIDIPPYRTPYAHVGDIGLYGDRLVLRTIVPSVASDELARYTLINTRTGAYQTFARPSTILTRGLYRARTDEHRMVPYTDSLWLASFQEGELMRTSDAGATWTMVDNIDRDERWGMTYVGVNRLYPRGDGTMSVLTERNRLMLQDTTTKAWYVAHMGPFAHSIQIPKTHRDDITKTNVRLDEDYGGLFRVRYGPSTAYFHTPDTLWTSGDVVTRWTSDGKLVDTTLHRHARLLKRVSEHLVVAAMDSVWFTFNDGKSWTYVSDRWPKYINGTDTVLAGLGDIVQADNNDLIAGLRGIRMWDTLNVIVDSIPGGIIRSDDSGVTWSRSTTGIPENLYVTSLIKLETGTLLCLALELALDPRYVNDLGQFRRPSEHWTIDNFDLGYAYIYRSTDNGRTWSQTHIFSSREFLPPVDPAFTLMPDGRAMAIHPEVGIAISPNDGQWFSVGDPFYIGNPNVSDVVFTTDGYAHFATDSGYLRIPIDRIMDIPNEPRPIGSLNTYVTESRILKISNTDFIPQTMRVLSLDGRTMQQSTNLNGITELDVSALANGTYVVTASTSMDVRSGLIQIY